MIPRDQVFIFSFESLVGEEGQDTIVRLLQFLGVGSAESSASLFPKENSAEKRCEGICEEAGLHEFLCSDFRHLIETYSEVNEFINLDPNRPPSEPVFRPFTERRPEKCKEADGSLVDFN